MNWLKDELHREAYDPYPEFFIFEDDEFAYTVTKKHVKGITDLCSMWVSNENAVVQRLLEAVHRADQVYESFICNLTLDFGDLGGFIFSAVRITEVKTNAFQTLINIEDALYGTICFWGY